MAAACRNSSSRVIRVQRFCHPRPLFNGTPVSTSLFAGLPLTDPGRVPALEASLGIEPASALGAGGFGAAGGAGLVAAEPLVVAWAIWLIPSLVDSDSEGSPQSRSQEGLSVLRHGRRS